MTDKTPQPKNVLGKTDFAKYLGTAAWLCSMSVEHRNKPFSTIESDLLPPLLLKQFRVVNDQSLPIAFLTWARASSEVRQKIESKQELFLTDWSSGEQIVVVDCIAPHGHKQQIINEFLESVGAYDVSAC